MFFRTVLAFLAVPTLLLTQQGLRLNSNSQEVPAFIRHDSSGSLNSLPSDATEYIEIEPEKPTFSRPAVEPALGLVEPAKVETPVSVLKYTDPGSFELPSNAVSIEGNFASAKTVLPASELANQTVIAEAEAFSLVGAGSPSSVSDQQIPTANPCDCADQYSSFSPTSHSNHLESIMSHPAMYTENYRLLQYRRMMVNGHAPQPDELQGSWRGVNKGVATVAIDKQFIKQFQYANGQLYGDNIFTKQVPGDQLSSSGWRPLIDRKTNRVKRQGKFLVQQPTGRGAFGNGAVLNYRKGGNRRRDPANLIVDQVVKLDENHMLGRATAKFGPIKIPLAYFVLERIPD